jgi:hypothetical protein
VPDVTHEQPLSKKQCIVVAIVAWTSVYGLVGVPMYGVATFLFAFSGQQYRMATIVNVGFFIVGLSGLVVSLSIGIVARVRTWPTLMILMAVLLSAILLWLLALVLYWMLSFQLGAGGPPA